MTQSVRPGELAVGPKNCHRSHGVSVSGSAHRRAIHSCSSEFCSHVAHTGRPYGSGDQFWLGETKGWLEKTKYQVPLPMLGMAPSSL